MQNSLELLDQFGRFQEKRSKGGLVKAENLHPEKMSLRDTQLVLDDLFSMGTPTRTQYRTVIGHLGRPDVLSSIISSTVADPMLLEEIGKRSFLHNNGMERINLLSTDLYNLRLHIWWQGTQNGMVEDPHDHVYNFASQVVYGKLVNDLYTRSREGEPVDIFEVATVKAGVVPVVSQIGEGHLRQAYPGNGFLISDAMNPYTMGKTAVHKLTADPNDTVITLNLRGPDERVTTNFFTYQNSDHLPPKNAGIDVSESLMRVLSLLTR